MMVSIFPQCSVSISDKAAIKREQSQAGLMIAEREQSRPKVKDVLADPEKYDGATVATPDMLTADMISWSLGARVGSKISKQFALQNQAERVDYNANQQTADPEGGEQTGGNTAGGGNTGNCN